MSEQDIIDGMIAAPGQSRDERTSAALDPGYAQIDERDGEALLAAVQALAAKLPYESTGGTTGTWAPMFAITPAQLAELGQQGKLPAQLALLQAFAAMYQLPRALQNRVAERHLDFHQRRVLGLEPHAATPDRAHVLLTLKKGVTSMVITPTDVFTAGKDDSGVELRYVPTTTTVINNARVDSLRSIHVDPGTGRIRHAPIANSLDGLGTPMDQPEPSWPGFGTNTLPLAEIGFAIGSPLLRLAASTRTITLQLTLQGANVLSNRDLSGMFVAALTGEQGWISVMPTFSFAHGTLTITIELAANVGAIIDYDAAIHDFRYVSATPLLRLLCSHDATLGYRELAAITVSTAKLEVEVEGLIPTTLDNDYGKLKPNKPFVAFGPEPRKGARLAIGCPEALNKPLRRLELHWSWKDAPEKFTDYADQPNELSNHHFTAHVSFEDGGGWTYAQSGKALFDGSDPRKPHALSLQPVFVPLAMRRHVGSREEFVLPALNRAGNIWAQDEASRKGNAAPSINTRAPGSVRSDAITLELEQSFMHAEYRKQQLSIALGILKPPPNPLPDAPYTPTVQSLTLSYHATSGLVSFSNNTEKSFAHPNLQFFHHDCFGQRREHSYLRNKLGHVQQKSVPLLPEHGDAGELLIGMADMHPGDGVTLLFQVAEGSTNPLRPRADVDWSVLIDNYWYPLRDNAYAFDSTNRLVASGIVKLITPTQTTTTSTLLPTNRVWLRASVNDVEAVCRLRSVDANAVELRFEDHGNSPTHLTSALPAKKIKKLVSPRAELKKVVQPYASFGGAAPEQDSSFRTRVAERLRHRQRAISSWDYERIVLEAFPQLYRVKCIPHAKLNPNTGLAHYLAPGHVTLVVIPNLRNKNAVEPLQPRVEADTITRIADFVRVHAGMGQTVWVRNPEFDQVQLTFEVRFRPGYDFNHYKLELEQALIRSLSPWAFEPEQPLYFGAGIHRSQVLHFVERLEYVDYVRKFEMLVWTGAKSSGDVREAWPSSPAAVLVSYATHKITEAPAK